MSEIALIRPGRTDFDDQHRMQGTLNLPLNRQGEEQVAELIKQLEAFKPEVIFVAPIEPALGTAKALQEALGTRIKVAEEWRNLDIGLWQGLSVDELKRKYPKAFRQWSESPETVCPPKGETVSEAVERIEKVLRKAIRKRDRFCIVAPEPFATLIRCTLLCEALSLPKCVCSSNGESAGPQPVPVVEFIHCQQLGEPGSLATGSSGMMEPEAFATISRRGETT